MTYEKALAKTIVFDYVEFMAMSGGPAAQAQAEQRALSEQEVLDAQRNGNWSAKVYSATYDATSGTWTIVVEVDNPSGKTMHTFTYDYT